MNEYLAVVNALVGQAMPLLTEVINTKITDRRLRFAIAMLISVALGAVTTVLSGQISTTEISAANLLSSMAVVFVSSQAAYNLWFKKSDLELKINTAVNDKI